MRRRKVLVSAKDHKRMLDSADPAFATFLQAMRQAGARPGEIRAVTAAMLDGEVIEVGEGWDITHTQGAT
jgi:hypothetical protein